MCEYYVVLLIVRFPLPDCVLYRVTTSWILDISLLLCENSNNQSNFNQAATISHILRDTAAAVLSLTFHLFLKALFRFVFVIPPTAFYGWAYIHFQEINEEIGEKSVMIY